MFACHKMLVGASGLATAHKIWEWRHRLDAHSAPRQVRCESRALV